MSINSTWRYATVMLLVMFSLVTFAQERSVSGKVVDENGDPLPGVAVLVKGTTKGGTTNFDGEYKITLSEGETTLSVSYIGYKTQDIVVGNQSIIDFQMEVDAEQLDEVVVIGYGSVKKEDATGSIETVNANDFNQGAITSPQDLLNGKVAGVNITTTGGAPGAGSTIRIRGGSSLSASNDPLIVIDGVPIDSEGVAGMQNPLNSVNPNDIETFTVLKDASATAIYGSRASNGVIIITTKKGSKGKIKIDYTGNVSYAVPNGKIDVLGGSEYSALAKQLYPNISDQVGTASTDWQREVIKGAVSTDHNVSVAGTAADKLPYRVSVGYTNQNGILETSNLERFTGNISLTPKFFDDHLSVNLNLKGMLVKNRFADNGAIGEAVSFDPTRPVKDGSPWDYGHFTWLDASGNPIVLATQNPVARLEYTNNTSDVRRSIGNMQLDYKLHFFPDLKANLNVGYDYSWSDGSNIQQDSLKATFPDKGFRSTFDQEKRTELLDFTLQYVKDIASIESKVDVMLGYSWQHFYRKGSDFATNGDGTIEKTPFTPYSTESYLVSFFGRLNYTFKDRYLLTVTVRNDGTSRFSPDTRWGLFPAFALAWNIKKESFLDTSDKVSTLKLRLGYGLTGQQNINQGDYPYLPLYTQSTTTADVQVGTNPDGSPIYSQTYRPNGYDANIKWETTATYNAGIDFGFLDDRFTGSLDGYIRYTSDLLNVTPVPAGSNLNNQVLANIGNLENRGFEFNFNAKVINNSKLNWNVGFNLTYNQNKITKLQASDDPSYDGVYTGGIAGGTGLNIQVHSVGYPSNSFFVLEQVYDNSGKPIEGVFVDRNGDGQITEGDRYRFQDPAADVFMGFNTNLAWKQWDFSLNGRVRFNNYVYNNVNSVNGVLDRVNQNGTWNNVTRDALETGFVTGTTLQKYSNYYVQNATFLRLDNLMLGYNFKEVAQGAINLRVYTTVNNLAVFTNYKGLDPEVDGGIDNNVYPRPTTFLLGVNLGF
ncbi:SusC/RagA family TonB-linked outer membrane protein [Flammeovirga aprica]|nr:TonB-dependent receptor [Flammeovirga aprica]